MFKKVTTLLSGILICLSLSAQTGSFTYDGLLRDYIVHLPTGYNATNNYPLVLNLHGYGSNATQQKGYSKMDYVSDINGFIVVYPNGVDNAWNASFVPGVDDVGFISALIDTLDANYAVNIDRVYACGMSNGGFMSYHLACTLNNKIAAIASVTGSMTTPTYLACNPSRAVPVMEIHGTTDAVVEYSGNAGFAHIDSVIAFWVNNNNISSSPVFYAYPNTNTGDNCTAEQYTYHFGNDSTEVVLIKIIDGGHTWPDAIIDVPAYGNTNHDINGSEVIWDFFNKFNINGRRSNIETSIEQPVINLGKIYPNPFNNNLVIENYTGLTEISIYNLLGKRVMQVNSNGARNILNTAELNNGIYFIHLKTEKNEQIFRLIKQNKN